MAVRKAKKIGYGDLTAICDETEWGRDGVLADTLMVITGCGFE